MFYINAQRGRSLFGDITICDIKVKNKHGKKTLVAIWHYTNRYCLKLNESEIRINNGRMVFNTGSEGFINVVPSHISKKYEHLIKKIA